MIQGLLVDTLTKKLGPLPIWVWAILVGGGAGAVLLLRNKNQPAASTDTTNADGTQTTDQTSSDPYANYLDNSGLYNGYGASDAGSFGAYAGGGANPYFPGNYSAPSAPVATTDPAILAAIKKLQAQIAAENKRIATLQKTKRNKPKPKPPRFSHGPNPPRRHTGHMMTGGGLPKRNAHQHLVGA